MGSLGEFRECCGQEGKHPCMGPYLPIKIVCVPCMLCDKVWEWPIAGDGDGDAVLIELQ